MGVSLVPLAVRDHQIQLGATRKMVGLRLTIRSVPVECLQHRVRCRPHFRQILIFSLPNILPYLIARVERALNGCALSLRFGAFFHFRLTRSQCGLHHGGSAEVVSQLRQKKHFSPLQRGHCPSDSEFRGNIANTDKSSSSGSCRANPGASVTPWHGLSCSGLPCLGSRSGKRWWILCQASSTPGGGDT